MSDRLAWLSPRQWPLAFGLGLLWLAAQLPLPLAQGFGRGLGLLAWAVLPSRRRIVRQNLALCFPALDEAERHRLERASFASAGMGLIEGGIAWWGRAERLPVRYEGLEHLTAARAEGRGVLLLGAHFTALEMGGRLMALKVPMNTVYKAAKNPHFDAVMRARRARYFGELIANDNLRGMLKVLKEGGICWYGADQDFGPEASVFAPFFGVPTATLTLTSKIVERSQAKVVFIYPERLPRAQGYVMHLVPVPEIPSGDVVADATVYNALIERFARHRPADYFWLHRRFKTRPEGVSSPYL
ncbi:lipid A biosynthesis acyltransferase [Thiofaba sp. EF100]|uniref:lysophospholipid acyltransferase family protein n=1 Tax=Thiofaba sp. EF100 TaxID=3121274 RepID=UPI0032221FCD